MQGTDLWRELRGMRASNPASIKAGSERSRVFNASLEQAEQFFKAAQVMGYETRPVVLFYGLSQLGRAIAAAADSSLLETKDSWQLSGHGIRVPALPEVARKGRLSDLMVQDQGKGAFTQLAKILNSSSVPSPTPLELFWNALPETRGYFLGENGLFPALTVADGVDEVNPPGDWGRARIILFSGCPEGLHDLKSFLDAYPALRQVEPPSDRYKRGVVRHGLLREIYMEPPKNIVLGKFGKLYGVPYRGKYYLFPEVPETGKSLHPILYWWPVLYSLSMLARYEPSGWAKMVDVDRNVDAVSIEKVLDVSIDSIPEVALAAIGQVSLSEEQRESRRVSLEDECRNVEIPTLGEMIGNGYQKLKRWTHGGHSD